MVSVALGIETDSFDSITRSFAQRSGFDYSGVDCVLDGTSRMSLREGFAYYSGIAPSRAPRSISSGMRSSIVVMNGVRDSASHQPWEVLYNSHNYSTSNGSALLASIDAVVPGGSSSGVSYDAWALEQGLSEQAALPFEDPDWDGLANALEFYFDTSPWHRDANPLQIQSGENEGVVLRFPVGRGRQGIRVEVEASNSLDEWWSLDLSGDTWEMEEGESIDRATITLTQSPGPFLRLRASMDE